MTTHRTLLGEAPNGLYHAQTGDGVVVKANEVVFPILRQEPSKDLHLVGTGFFIAENGIFVTAKHVVTSVFDAHDVPRQPLVILQLGPDNTYYQRPVHRATHHAVADVAVGIAWPMRHNTTGLALPNKLLRLLLTPPPIGEVVATYAYPKTTILHGTPQQVHLESTFFEGHLVESFPGGRDRILLPGACFRTTMVVHGGASGGPVVGQSGRAFAVNSTGLENDFVSFVSPVSDILDLGLPGVVVPGAPDARVVTIRELRDRGFVVCE